MAAIVTPLKTEAEKRLAEQFATLKAELPGAGPVRQLREDAFAGFEAKGLPHRRLESWRYTDLRSLMRDAMPVARKAERSQSIANRLAVQTVSGTRLVLIDGMFSAADSDLPKLPSGLSVRPLAEALATDADALAARLQGPEIAREDSALMLNAALAQDGVVIEIAPGTVLDRPLIVLSLSSGQREVALYSRVIVSVGAGAKVTLLELHESTGHAPIQVNHAIAFEVADSAQVEHVRMVTRQRADTVQVHTLLADLGAEVEFASVALTADSGVLRQQSFLRYGGEHTKAALRGISLLRKQEHSDVTLVMDHAVPHCESREHFQTIVADEATGVFQGKVVVRPHAQKTDGGMKSNALLLDEGATMFNKPELEIFADDVVCGHGATVAQLDSEQLFYLMARGLPRAQAEALVLAAFAGVVSETLSDDEVREIFGREVEAWLAQRGKAA